MKFNKQTKIAHRGRAAAASAVFVALQFAAAHTAHAQVSALAQHMASQGGAASAAKAIPPNAASALACTAPAEFVHFDRPLLHTMRRLSGGQPLNIVAIGSSSTAGAGATSPEASYPSRLSVELRTKFPGHEITVLNRGVNGEETDNMMARFGSDVMAAHPQLVLWQIGTNSVLRDHPLGTHNVELREGIEELKNSGADVVLIDPQFAPAVLAKPETPGMVEQIAEAAKDENVDLFHRFAVMRDWYEHQHYSYSVFVSPDGLHMNDWGYACWAKLLAGSIAEAANPPVASAVFPPSH
jgi:lysophospholipase L1-like esterase